MKTGGIILCGGKSSRMGTSKAMLPVGDELMLQRVVRILGEEVQPLVVVAAVDQELPALPDEVQIVRDSQPGRGPLQGLRDGLSALPDGVEAAYATSCDVPLLKREFVRRMIDSLGEDEIAVPRDGKFHHPLAAVYRTSIVPKIDQLLEEDRLRPVYLFESCDTREIEVEELRCADAHLASMLNCNTLEGYREAMEKLT